MSIFEGEIRKVGLKEDSLTAKVFGVFDIIDRHVLLEPFLKSFDIPLKEGEVKEFKIEYWKSQGAKEPDVIISGKEKCIFIESKKDVSLGEGQLIKEYEDGLKRHKNFYLIAITSDFVEPDCINKARQTIEKSKRKANIYWTRWHDVNTVVKENSNSQLLDETGKKLVAELSRLLDSQGYKTFNKFHRELKEVCLLPASEFLEDFGLFIGEIAKRLNLEIGGLSRGYQGSGLDTKSWLPEYLSFALYDNHWGKDWHHKLFLDIYPREIVPYISVGYLLSFQHGWDIHKEILQKKKEEIATNIPKEVEIQIDGELLADISEIENRLEKASLNFYFYYKLTQRDISHSNVLENAIKKVDVIRDFVNKHHLFATNEEKDKYNKEKADKPENTTETP